MVFLIQNFSSIFEQFSSMLFCNCRALRCALSIVLFGVALSDVLVGFSNQMAARIDIRNLCRI